MKSDELYTLKSVVLDNYEQYHDGLRILLGQHRTIEREIAVSKKEPAEASPSSFGEAQSDCQRRAGSQNEIRQSE